MSRGARAVLLALGTGAAASCAAAAGAARKPSGEFAPGRFRTVPDTTAEGRRQWCAWKTREGVELTLAGPRTPADDSARRAAADGYLTRLTRAVDELFMPSDSVTELRQVVLQTTVPAADRIGPITALEPSGLRAFDSTAAVAVQVALIAESDRPPPEWLVGATLLVGVGRRPTSTDTLLARFHLCAAMPTGGASPKYPDDLRQRGVEGRVLVEFVIDTAGRADMRTFLVREDPRYPTPERGFVSAVYAAMPRMTYRPATRDGKRVRQLVIQPFAFGIGMTPTPGAAAPRRAATAGTGAGALGG